MSCNPLKWSGDSDKSKQLLRLGCGGSLQHQAPAYHTLERLEEGVYVAGKASSARTSASARCGERRPLKQARAKAKPSTEQGGAELRIRVCGSPKRFFGFLALLCVCPSHGVLGQPLVSDKRWLL